MFPILKIAKSDKSLLHSDVNLYCIFFFLYLCLPWYRCRARGARSCPPPSPDPHPAGPRRCSPGRRHAVDRRSKVTASQE